MNVKRKLYGEKFWEKEKLIPIGVNHPIKLEYYETTYQKNDEIVYGIEIVKKEILGHTIIVEGKMLKKITNSKEKNERILNSLMKNDVTPLTLEEIVEDLVKQKESTKK